MNQLADTCLAFPPDRLPDDKAYDKAVKNHLVNLVKLLDDTSAPLRKHAPELLELLDPAAHSISYLAILHTICVPNVAGDRDFALEKLVVFLLSFDARQLRYTGSHLLDLLHMVGTGQLLPPPVATEVLATAMLRIDPSGSMFTSTHIQLAKLAYTTDNISPALQVIDKNIVFYPGMANSQTPDILCDLSLSPSVYISKETGLTATVKPPAIMEYDMLCGLMYCARRDWAKAHAAFERVITFPTRDQGVSKIMSEAFKKWVLVSLLYKGKATVIPSYTGSGANKAYVTLGKLYREIAVTFETEGASELKTEAEKHAMEWMEDGNSGLIQEVLAAYQEWQILNLQQLYSKISISEIRRQTKSAQTGDILAKDEDVESLIQNMVISGTLKGVIEKNDDGTTFLTFLPPSAALSEVEYAKQMAGTAARLKALQPVFKATNERLGTSREYIKNLVKLQQQRGDKDLSDNLPGFDSQVDDEDLMGGLSST